MSKQIFTRLILSFILFLSLPAFKVQGQATIQTDLLDYPPGSTAIITGSGFQPGETVTLQVVHVDGDSLGTDPQYHQPFTTVADASGNISSSWWVPNDGDALGANFRLEVTGQSSGLHAEWFFTDGAGDGSIVISPLSICSGNTGTSLIFSFRSKSGASYGTTSQAKIIIQPGWTTPTLANLNVLPFGTASVGTLTISGSTITVPFTCSAGSSNGFDLTFSGVTVPTVLTSTLYTFTSSTRSGSSIFSDLKTVDQPTTTINPLPTLTGASQAALVCAGSGATINLTGLLANSTSTINYTINGSAQTPLTGVVASGTGASFTSANLTAANNGQTLQITSVTTTSATPNCTQSFAQNVTLSVRPTPTASISGTTSVCQNATATNITFNNPQALAVAITYNINGGTNTTVNIAASTTATVAALTGTAGTFAYNLVSVAYQAAPTCSNTISGTATVTINGLPNNTSTGFSGNTICATGDIGILTFDALDATFVSPYTISYTDGTTTWSQLIGSAAATSFNAAVNPTVTTNYTLVSIANGNGCSTITGFGDGSAQITVRPTPIASIGGTTAVCQGSTSPNITFTHPQTLAVTITYNINGGTNTTINVAASATATLAVSTATSGTFNYNLVSVAYQSAPSCSNIIAGTATVTVRPTPTAIITGTTTVCQGSTSTNITFTNPQSLGETITYNINGAANTTINVGAGATAIVAAPTGTAGTFAYNLVSVVYQTTPTCSNTISGIATVTVRATPTATIALNGTNPICSGSTTGIKFTGPSGGIVTYKINGGSDITGNVGGGGILNLTTVALISNTTYSLVSVAYGDAPDCSASASGNVTVTVNQPPSITTQPTNQTVTYGDAAGFTVTATGTSLTYQWQEKVGAGSFANITNGGIYSGATTASLSLSHPTVAMSSNQYKVIISGTCTPLVTSDGTPTLTVTAKGLTAATTVASKVYNGSAVPGTVTLGTVTGLIGSETLVITPTASNFATANVGTDKATTILYGLANGTGLASNYSMVTLATTANITALDIAGSFTASNKVYDGNTSATVLTRTPNGIIGTDAVTLTGGTATFSDKNVANGKTVTLTGASLAGADAANYNLTSVGTTTANITIRQVNVTAQTDTKNYDGNNSSSVLPVGGALQGLTDAYTTVGTQTYDNKNVGTAKTMTATGAVINDGNGGLNYNINYVTNTTGVITIRQVNVTAQTDTKNYDGNNSSSVLPVGGALQGLTDAYTTVGTQTYNNKNVGTAKTMTATGAVINDGNGGLNYNIAYVTNNTGEIKKITATVTAQTSTKNYDGNTSSSAVPVVTGLISPDAIATAPTQTYDNRNVGTTKVMTAAGLVINDANSGGNYNITYVPNSTGIITVRVINVIAASSTKVYDGTVSSTIVPLYTLQTGDVASTNPIEVYDNALVGTGKTMTASGLVINDGNGGSNYSISYVTNTMGVIQLAPTVTTLITSAVSVRYMDNLTMTAKIKPLNTGSTLTGTVAFSIGGISYGAAAVVPIPGSVDGSVQAMMIKQVTNLPAGYTVTAVFSSTNANYSGGQDTKPLTVIARDASPYVSTGFYAGDHFAWTTGPNTSTATLTMTAAVKDANNPSGDVRGAKVSFYFVNGTTLTAIPSAQNLPVGLVDVTDGSVGTASAIVQLNIGAANAASFQIAVKVTGAYTNDPNSSLSQTIVTVSKPIAGGYIVGGSQITNTNSSGYIKGATGLTTDYQFDIQYTKSGTNPKGKANIMVRSYYDKYGILDSKLHTYLISTNAIALLNVANATALGVPTGTGTFSAKANLVEQLADLSNVSIEGGATFQMTAYQSNCDQQISITLSRNAGGIWFSSNWNANTASSQLQAVTSGSHIDVSGGGSCGSAIARSVTISVPNAPPVYLPVNFTAKVLPNPSHNQFTFLFSSPSKEVIKMNVLDYNGRLIEQSRSISPKQSLQIGQQYRPGVYYAEFIQGSEKIIIKLIKEAN